MFNSNVLVSVNPFNQGNPDKNGKDPVILNVVAGKAPNRLVLAGTVAENSGFKVGHVYYANCRETEANDYGRQFRWTVIQESKSVVETAELSKALGQPQVFDASKAPEKAPELTKEAEREMEEALASGEAI